MKSAKTVLALAVTLVALATVLAADASTGPGMRWRGSQGWGLGSQYARIYDAKTVETVKGEVVEVGIFTPATGMGQGIHLRLRTDDDSVAVHLGPRWYMENQDLTIEIGDVLEVTGSRVMHEGTQALIAAEVTKGDATLRLRDGDGYPAWAGWRRR